MQIIIGHNNNKLKINNNIVKIINNIKIKIEVYEFKNK